MWFSHLSRGRATFVAECWSGDTNKASKYHYYLVEIKLPRKVEIDQIKLLEEEIELLKKEEVDVPIEEG